MMLNSSFYRNSDVVATARALLGKVLVTRVDDVITAGVISETEAYHEAERACHAYNGRRTTRTEMLYAEGGRAYVYLCYGIHHLFNVVTGPADEAQAVLIRGVLPLEGIDTMMMRRGRKALDKKLSAGPGTLSVALGITTALNGHDLDSETIWIEDRGLDIPPIEVSERIGIDYAGEDAALPWRFNIPDFIHEKPVAI